MDVEVMLAECDNIPYFVEDYRSSLAGFEAYEEAMQAIAEVMGGYTPSALSGAGYTSDVDAMLVTVHNLVVKMRLNAFVYRSHLIARKNLQECVQNLQDAL